MTKFLKLYLNICVCFICIDLSAQKSPEKYPFQISNIARERNCIASYNKTNIELKSQESVKNYIINSFENFKFSHSDLIIENTSLSPAGKHFTSYQTYKNRKIYNSQIKVNTDKNGYITSIFDNSFPIKNEPNTLFPDLNLIIKHLPQNDAHYKPEEIFFKKEDEFIPALLITIFESVENHRELIFDNRGEIVYERDLNMYYNSNTKSVKDSLAKAKVFLPDPLTSAEKSYGSPYLDDNNADIPEIDDQLITVNINVKFDSVFHLENEFIKITEHSAPENEEVISLKPEFIYNRSQTEFENINIFYHITKFQNYIQSLGFKNLANYQINADPHSLNGKDQSTFSSSFNPPRLNFGDGGIDDGEDADVIVHEYGHAILFSAAPNTNYGTEREAIDEGTCDYFAATYSKDLNPYSWEKVFNWDGHNEFWEGRYCNSPKHYPENLTGTIHQKGEIWSSTLMQIMEAIGREQTDIILLQSAHNYSTNITMRDAALLFLQADSILNKGANYNTIFEYFLKRGLISNNTSINKESNNPENIIIKNISEFKEGKNLTVVFNSSFTGSITLIDFNGKILSNQLLNNSNSVIFMNSDLPQGLYFLEFDNTREKKHFKLIR